MIEYSLEFLTSEVEKKLPLTKRETLIGRSEQCDIRMAQDPSLSRVHAEIILEGPQVLIRDLNSRNGTFVNGQRIQHTQLENGDEIGLGRQKLKLVGDLFEEPVANISMVVPMREVQDYLGRPEKEGAPFLPILAELTEELLNVNSEEEAFEKTFKILCDRLGPDRGIILKQSDNGFQPVYNYRQGDFSNLISTTVVETCVSQKSSILSQNMAEDTRFSESQSVIMLGVNSAITSPIIIGEKVWGTLYFDRITNAKPFTRDDLYISSIIANNLGNVIHAVQSRARFLRENRIRRHLEKYHSPEVVDRIVRGKETESTVVFDTEEMEISVLFLDIVGFSTLAEKMPAVEVGRILNRFFTEMSDVVFTHQGTLDKFIGDGIMVLFGAPFENIRNAQMAVQTALSMLRSVRELNLEGDLPGIRVRIGINSGKAIVGDFGSSKRIEYTAIGNMVNIASRLQTYVANPDEIVIGEETYERVKGEFEAILPLGEVTVPGIQKKLKAYRLETATLLDP